MPFAACKTNSRRGTRFTTCWERHVKRTGRCSCQLHHLVSTIYQRPGLGSPGNPNQPSTHYSGGFDFAAPLVHHLPWNPPPIPSSRVRCSCQPAVHDVYVLANWALAAPPSILRAACAHVTAPTAAHR
ncbi:hypothetical protein A0H81_13879 [Grifola frondosa]|uniref:Uncharacterized protein n=1 Tax=Grifola frondosa TaxID=5627 RepID=A0A1C7LNF9_GRIFR|nr:hypothetical protein A0H81_13879 [Grifola frondosa]